MCTLVLNFVCFQKHLQIDFRRVQTVVFLPNNENIHINEIAVYYKILISDM